MSLTAEASFELLSEIPGIGQSRSSNGNEEHIVVPTRHGDVAVVREGDPSKYCILTAHDIGLNYGNCFESFIHQQDVWEVLQHYQFLHLNFLGQEEGAKELGKDVTITIPKTIDQIKEVLHHFHIEHVLCMGVGLGATLLTAFGVKNPNRMLGMIAISPLSTRASWLEWTHTKMLTNAMRVMGFHSVVETQWMERYFSHHLIENATDLIDDYKRDLHRIPQSNLFKLMQCGASRPAYPFNKVEFDSIVFLGRGSTFYDSGINYFSELKTGTVELFELMEGSHLLHVHLPQQVVKPLTLYLQGQGLPTKFKT